MVAGRWTLAGGLRNTSAKTDWDVCWLPKRGSESPKILTPCVRLMSLLCVKRPSTGRGCRQAIGTAPPDLAVEIISPSDTYTEVAEKVDDWLRAGCAMIWVVNLRREVVEVYRPAGGFTVLSGDDVLEGSEVIAGFRCRVRDLFV